MRKYGQKWVLVIVSFNVIWYQATLIGIKILLSNNIPRHYILCFGIE